MNTINIAASVVICTRNRGKSAAETIESVLSNDFVDFEVILIDQSTNDDTECAVNHFKENPQFRYIRSSTVGLGYARNIGLLAARSPFVVFTDDDCTVPPNWIAEMISGFSVSPEVALVFSNVEPAPYDHFNGFTPFYKRYNSRLAKTIRDKVHVGGIGASMAVRRSTILEIGGFDELLAAGSALQAADDVDITIRVLIHKFWVYETNKVAVVHYGFRTNQELQQLTSRDWFGIGALYAKLIMCSYFSVLPDMAYHILLRGLWDPFSKIFRLQAPRGLKRLLFFYRGFTQGLKTPIDRQHITYKVS